jgi:hypothetical protein
MTTSRPVPAMTPNAGVSTFLVECPISRQSASGPVVATREAGNYFRFAPFTAIGCPAQASEKRSSARPLFDGNNVSGGQIYLHRLQIVGKISFD